MSRNRLRYGNDRWTAVFDGSRANRPKERCPLTWFLGARLPSVTTDDYAHWDAAYVLGALSVAHRREFEAHLRFCPSCLEGVVELSGMPALLSRLDIADVALLELGDDSTPPL